MADLEVRDNTGAVLSSLKKAIETGLEEIGLVAEGYAKRLCPVDTGRLRNSITHTVDDSAAYIGTNVEYAQHVEFGTRSQMAANGGMGYLRPAAEEHGQQYRAILEKHMKEA